MVSQKTLESFLGHRTLVEGPEKVCSFWRHTLFYLSSLVPVSNEQSTHKAASDTTAWLEPAWVRAPLTVGGPIPYHIHPEHHLRAGSFASWVDSQGIWCSPCFPKLESSYVVTDGCLHWISQIVEEIDLFLGWWDFWTISMIILWEFKFMALGSQGIYARPVTSPILDHSFPKRKTMRGRGGVKWLSTR